MKKLQNVCSAGATALALVFTAVPVFGQDTAVKETDTEGHELFELEAFEVSGYQLQALKSIEAKRVGDGISDSVSQDNIGRLPDFNAGEALKRLPGVAVENDQAEGRFVVVRGLDPSFNRTSVDGTELASPDRDGREVFMDVVPAGLSQRIEVVKTFTPDMDANAIGGTVNFVTRSPFDFEDGFFSMTAAMGDHKLDSGYVPTGPSGNAQAVFAKHFGDEGKLAAVFQLNYFRRDSFIPTAENGDEILFYEGPEGVDFSTRSDRHEDADGNKLFFESDYALPEERKWLWYSNDRQRYGGSAKIEYRPNDDWTTSLNLYYSTSEDDEARMETKIWNRQRGEVVNFSSPTTGTITDAEHTTQLGQFDFERSVWGLQLSNKYYFNDRSKLWFQFAYSASHFENPETFTRFKQSSADFDFDWSGGRHTMPEFTPVGGQSGDALTLSNFDFEKHELNDRELDEDVFTFKIDYGHNNENGNLGWGYKVGASARVKDRTLDESRDRWSFGDGLTLADVDVDFLCPEGMIGCVADDFIVMNVDSLNDLVARYIDSPDTNFSEQESVDNDRDYSADESVYAAFIQGVYATERSRLIFGLRNEKTEFESTGRRRTDGVYGDFTNSSDYDHWFPSATFTYDLADNLNLRFAASESMSRPSFSQIAVRGERISDNGSEVRISRSNPDLKPRESQNFDASLEWYIGRTGLFSVGLFQKNIDNIIFTNTVEETGSYDLDGDGILENDVPFNINQPVNAASAEVKGLELGFVRTFDFLPEGWNGLGVGLNATFVDGNLDVLMSDGNIRELDSLFKQVDTSYNAMLFYDYGPFEGRIAYNKQSDQLNRLRTNPNDVYREEYDAPREQIDLQLRYDVNKRFGVFLNVWNLTEEGRTENFGFDQDVVRVRSSYGRAIFLGISLNNLKS